MADRRPVGRANGIPTPSVVFRLVASRVLEVALIPLKLAFGFAQKFLGQTGPPAFHVILLLSLLPLIGIWSLGAGLVVRSWIPKGWKQIIYLQYGQGQPPYADIILPTLSSGQQYEITLDLVMPLHAKNTELGNFMTSITITTPSNVTLAYSSRPSLIFPNIVSSFFPFSPLIYSGALATHSLSIPLIESFSASSYLSSLRARIQVGRADGWTSVGSGQGRELVVVQAFARGVPIKSGIRGFFMRHSLLLLAVTTTAFFISTSIATLIAYLLLVPRIRLSPVPLAVPPSYFDIGKSPEQIRAEAEQQERLQIKAEDEEFVNSPLSLSADNDQAGSAAGTVTAGASQLSASASVISGTEDEGNDTEDSGSAVEVGHEG